MKPGSRKFAAWEGIIREVRKGATKAEVEQILGSPSRTISTGEVEILSYCDEQIGDTLYGVRVSYQNGRVNQCYLGLELCDGDARPKAQKRSERFQLLLVILLAAVVILLYAWIKA